MKDTEAGEIYLSNGSVVSGDLIIAADGVHSIAVEAILGHANPALPTGKYNFCYRFLIPSSEIAADPLTKQFDDGDDGRMKFMVEEDKRLVWYPCRKSVIIYSRTHAITNYADIVAVMKSTIL
jgi:salicylate hydroxylase